MGHLRWSGWMLGVTVLASVGLPQVAVAEQPLEQLPKDLASFSLAWVALPQTMVEVTKDYGPLAGASWGVVKGSSEAVERVLTLLDEAPSVWRGTQIPHAQDALSRGDEARSPAWLNVDDVGERQAHHEPVLLRYTF